jgi:demethylmenaquinone methyltransferase/2-methoxy-6-polyprenyl-1,4-benzoquinol methylase
VSQRTAHARELFAPLGPAYDRNASLLSFGQDPAWRRFLVARVPDDALNVLDVATGTAAVAIELAQRVPERHVVGVDQSTEMLAVGRERVARAGLDARIELREGRAEQLPFADGTFDALTFTYLMRYVADPAATIRELARVVRPGGCIANLEFAVPPNPVWRTAWIGYTRVVLPLAGLITGGREWYEVGRFLGPSITTHYHTYPVHWMQDAWRAAGIEAIGSRSMSLGGGLVMWGRRRAQ